MTGELPPDLPRYDLQRVMRQRQRLFSDAMWPAIGPAPLEGEAFAELVARTQCVLKRPRPLLFESLRHLAGSPLTAEAAMLTAWRLAGNQDKLRAGEPVRPWVVQHRDEWVPCTVLRATPTLTRKKERATEFGLIVMAGSPCGLRTSIIWSPRVCYVLSRRLGFSRRAAGFRYSKPVELVGLRLYGRVSAARSRETPRICEVVCPPNMAAWNRKTVLRLRCRVKTRCPNGWMHPCWQCAVGYETCAAATHFRTYVRKDCPGCQQSAAFDPESASPVCVTCTTKRILRGE